MTMFGVPEKQEYSEVDKEDFLQALKSCVNLPLDECRQILNQHLRRGAGYWYCMNDFFEWIKARPDLEKLADKIEILS